MYIFGPSFRILPSMNIKPVHWIQKILKFLYFSAKTSCYWWYSSTKWKFTLYTGGLWMVHNITRLGDCCTSHCTTILLVSIMIMKGFIENNIRNKFSLTICMSVYHHILKPAHHLVMIGSHYWFSNNLINI
jgi:hypothetical protein